MGTRITKQRSSTLPFKSVADGQQAHEKVAAQLKNAILDKKILPGGRLPAERDLAEIFNTSRVTVRSAILTLKNAGLINVKKGTAGGTFVSKDIGESGISERLRDIIKWKQISFQDVIEVRDVIEPQITYLAAKNATEEDIATIWATIEELERFFEVKKRFKSHDENFHKALAVAAKNPLLIIFQASLIDILFKFIYNLSWPEDHKRSILFHHRNIAEKVKEKDPESAMQAMVDHLADMRRILGQPAATKTLDWLKIS
jgi:GntR family transcriptional repressor for pyruvate dehydrogenase complex